MILLPDHKAVFISTTRCGTHSMFAVLKERYGGEHYKLRGDYHTRTVPGYARGWLKFVVTRNPYSRLASIWRVTQRNVSIAYGSKYKLRDGPFLDWPEYAKTLAEMAERAAIPQQGPTRIHLPQHQWLWKVPYDVILRLEDLDAECRKKLPFWTGPDRIERAPNVTDDWGPPWRELLQTHPETKDRARRWAGSDFDQFEYER